MALPYMTCDEEDFDMYLISAYFDEDTNNRIQQYINQVAKKTGNTYMLDGEVPPHVTISSFETSNIEQVIPLLEQRSVGLQQGTIQWTSISAFLPYVLYLAPVLNEYLHKLSVELTSCLKQAKDIRLNPYYQPFSWMPHTTIGKKLSKDEMLIAFEVLQHQFGPFQGKITKIGLAKTNPYSDIVTIDLL